MKKAAITGIGRYLPDNVVTNDMFTKIIDTSDEWITSRTGIKERRISVTENNSVLALNAAKAALENASVAAEEIDLIIVATMTPDAYFPSTAAIVQGILGAKNATAFDISAACSGFVFALNTATQMIRTGQHKKALVIGSEMVSKLLDWTDRSTCVLFGDGAGAVVVELSDDEGVIYSVTGTDGSRPEILLSWALPISNPFGEREEKSRFIQMDGREVFKFATRVIPEIIDNILATNNLTINDIAHIVPHQANYRIIESAAERFNISTDRFYMNLDKCGNTSAASIPIALAEMNDKGLLKKGDYIIIAGFGGGLTWGGSLIRWTK